MISLSSAPAWRAVTVDTTGQPGGQLRVGIVDARPNGSGPTFLVSLGYQACIEPAEMQRFQVMATALTARLLVIENPGYGYVDSRLLPDERRALRHGDFGVLAQRLLQAAARAAGEDPLPGQVALIGYSLGASIGAAMARVNNTSSAGTVVDTLVLVEPVAVRRWTVSALVVAMAREVRNIQRYLDLTAGVEHAVAPVDRRVGETQPGRRRADLWALANALRKAKLMQDALSVAPQLRRVVIVRGEASLLSPRTGVARLAAAFARRGITARLVTTVGHHGFWQSLPTVADVTADVSRLLTDEH